MPIDYSCVVCDPSGFAIWMPTIIVVGIATIIFFILWRLNK